MTKKRCARMVDGRGCKLPATYVLRESKPVAPRAVRLVVLHFCGTHAAYIRRHRLIEQVEPMTPPPAATDGQTETT